MERGVGLFTAQSSKVGKLDCFKGIRLELTRRDAVGYRSRHPLFLVIRQSL